MKSCFQELRARSQLGVCVCDRTKGRRLYNRLARGYYLQLHDDVVLYCLEHEESRPSRMSKSRLKPNKLDFLRRCCTALAESEIRLWWWPRYVSSMKYPKRCQYKHAKQKKYHVRNWAEYNEGLRRRGDLTVWFDEEAIANWKADKTGKPGGQRVYSDMAIETGLVVRMVYKLAYRQTEGFLHSIASLLGLGIEIPDYSTLCRRSRLLRKKLRIPKAASTQPIHLMIDSTGLRIHVGNARKPPKQRAWRKLHIAVDRETGNIVASELTASRARDATRVPALLTQIQAPLVSVAADSAYDKEAVYEAIEAHSPGRRTRVVIPPQRNATLSQNSNTAMQERDRHIRAIERHGRREWYKLSGYTKRSMVRGNELNTELGARYSTRWLRSGCPIRTAPGDSATGTGRSAICSGPCNNASMISRVIEAPCMSERLTTRRNSQSNASRSGGALKVRSVFPAANIYLS